jgi:hypothetical protein
MEFNMKTTFTIISLAILSVFSAVSLGYDYNATFTQTAPTIDGSLATGEWDDAFAFSIVYPEILSDPYNGSYPAGWATPASAADLSADIYMAWDDAFIYIAVRVYDSELNFLNTSGGQLNSQDAVQLMFNPGNYTGNYASAGAAATMFDFAADTSDGAGPSFYGRNDAAFNDPQNVIMDASITADGYIIEIALKNEAFGLTPEITDSIGMGFILSDADGGSHETLLSDTSSDGAWDVTQTSSWNNFVFIGEDGCGLYGFASGDVDNDCYVTLADFSVLASEWLKCTDPADDNCVEIQ